MIMQANRGSALTEVADHLMCAGELKRTYKHINTGVPSVQDITHHGYIHIGQVERFVAWTAPLLWFNQSGFEGLDELGAVRIGSLLHDIGLLDGRPKHALNGAARVGSIVSPYGVDPRTIAIVRQLVRWHRAEDFCSLVEHVLPRADFILDQLQSGTALELLVPPSGTDEDPNATEVAEFLQLERSGIPMVRMLALLVLADVIDIGRSRVRKQKREILYHYMKESKRKSRTTLEDVLISRGVSYSGFDLANFAIPRLEVLFKDEYDETVASILIQQQRPNRRPKPAARTHRPKGRHAHSSQGLFLWARAFANCDDPQTCRDTLLAQPDCIWLGSNGQRPTRLVLRFTHDVEVCSVDRVAEIKVNYLAALSSAAKLLGLETERQISSGLDW